MGKLKLFICKRSHGKSYGHSDESVKKYESLTEHIESFFEGKDLRHSENKIIGLRVSNSGCNVWLVIHHHNRMNEHRIYTTQNDHLGKFGMTPVKTDLQRFLKQSV